LLTLEASAGKKKSTKDAGLDACFDWCFDNRKGEELGKCLTNCRCYYKVPHCKIPPGNPLPEIKGNASPQGTPDRPGVLDPVRPTPRPPTYQEPPTGGGVLQYRGVEGEPSATAPPGQEGKEKAPAPK